MFYYEYEFIVQNLIDILKEKQEAEEGHTKDYSNMKPDSMMKNASKYMPKMPSMPNVSFPSMPSSLKL